MYSEGDKRADTGPDAVGCVRHLRGLLDRWADDIVSGPGVAIPDTEEDLNWHAFLGHHQDMQGFDAGQFAGVDPYKGPGPFRCLRERGLGVKELADLWQIASIRESLCAPSTGGSQLARCVARIRSAGGHTGRELAEAWDSFKGRARKTKAILRAYMANSHLLGQHDHSFRRYLEAQTRRFDPGLEFPPSTMTSAYESFLIERIAADFFNVGETMAAYMVCDWLLWLWREGRIDWFTTFKPDSRHEQFAERFGFPFRSHESFVGFCREQNLGYPPRVVNEVIWLEGERGLSPRRSSCQRRPC